MKLRYAAGSPYSRKCLVVAKEKGLEGKIEILSPDDSQNEMIDKLDEYASLNIPYIWVVGPNHRRIYRYDQGSLLQQEALSVAERGLRLEPSAIFGERLS